MNCSCVILFIFCWISTFLSFSAVVNRRHRCFKSWTLSAFLSVLKSTNQRDGFLGKSELELSSECHSPNEQPIWAANQRSIKILKRACMVKTVTNSFDLKFQNIIFNHCVLLFFYQTFMVLKFWTLTSFVLGGWKCFQRVVDLLELLHK